MPSVRCIDPERAERWVNGLGSDTLPVLCAPPTYAFRRHATARYWIDFRRLSKAEREVVARYTAEMDGRPLDELMHQITYYGLPIEDHGDLVLIEDES